MLGSTPWYRNWRWQVSMTRCSSMPSRIISPWLMSWDQGGCSVNVTFAVDANDIAYVSCSGVHVPSSVSAVHDRKYRWLPDVASYASTRARYLSAPFTL